MPQFRTLPINILTVLNEDSHRIRAMEAGASGFLSKPFKRVELLTRVKALLALQGKKSDFISFDAVVCALLEALIQRSPEAAAASRRTAGLGERLALAMGLSTEEIGEMHRGLLLRDIGYMALPLGPAGTGNEPNQHAANGAQIAEHFGHELVDKIVRYHHCDLLSPDYPRGLGEDFLKLFNIAIVCTRLEHLLYHGPAQAHKAACATMAREMECGLWSRAETELLLQLVGELGFTLQVQQKKR